jgi:hypothetical protein
MPQGGLTSGFNGHSRDLVVLIDLAAEQLAASYWRGERHDDWPF